MHLRSQFIPLFTIFAGMPANIIFGSLNTLVTILPQPTILLSGIFVFLPIFTSFPTHACLPISILWAKLIGSLFKFVIVCASVHQISMPQLNWLSSPMLTFYLSSCKYKVTPLITTRLPISTLQLLATLETPVPKPGNWPMMSFSPLIPSMLE